MSHIFPIVLAGLLLGAPAITQAQQRWSIELRPGVAFPAEDLGDASLGTGAGFEANVAYHLKDHMFVYAGWDWHNFTSESSFAGSDMDFEETGYVFGLRFQHPIGGSETVALRIHGGGTFNHIEVEDPDGELIEDTGHGLGWEVGAALPIRAGQRWEFSPGVRYRSLDRDFDIEGTTTSGSLRYVAIEVGIARWF